MEFCAERGLYVGNTYFEHKNLHKYTRVARGQDGVEVKSMIDLVMKDMMIFVQDVREGDEVSQITMLYWVKSGWWGHGLRGENQWIELGGLEVRN